MYYVYILKSIQAGVYYVGSTENLERRVRRHNAGGSTWTKKYRPWRLIYHETFPTKHEVVKREFEIKGYKGGIQFKRLVV